MSPTSYQLLQNLVIKKKPSDFSEGFKVEGTREKSNFLDDLKSIISIMDLSPNRRDIKC